MCDHVSKDREEILRVVQMYVDSCAQGDGSMMEPAFHKNATINGEPIQTLFDGATQAGPTESHAQVDVLDLTGDIAVVRVVLKNYFGNDYIDYHSMRRFEDGWKITAKVFTEA